jgi:hypothetical protein
MSKKILVLISALMTLCAAQAFAWGIGVQGGYGLGTVPGGNVMLTAKFDQLPLIGLGVSGLNGGSNLSIGLTADWWLIKEPLAGALGIYLGPGAYLGLHTGNAAIAQFLAGIRLPVGLQLYPFKWLELFIEIAPYVGASIDTNIELDYGLMGAFGLRFWFK